MRRGIEEVEKNGGWMFYIIGKKMFLLEAGKLR